tara:strand:+ start:1905 stop:3839 length:1935 start_codon:yes stop_codon:yes gene_type:complete
MATNESRLRVTELDFDNIKNNLKFFLKGQDKFKDYDFEGSGMSILLDTLAYNTHYMAYNANMVANEMFLDSSSLRSSAVSHAKMLGYEVTSARAPKAIINVNLQTTDSIKTMSAGTAFTATVDGTNYQFVTISDVTRANSGNSVNFDSIEIYEGTYIISKNVVDSSNVDQKFILTDPRADTSTLTVKVQTSTSDTSTTTYTKADDITQLSATSTVYYLQEVERGRFEVYFGDGVISKALEDGNIVQLQYVVTNKGVANGVSSFTPPTSIDGATSIVVTTVSSAIGGAEQESVNSIKLKAPLNYSAQGRAVTTSDYEVYVKKLFANTQAVSVWGGEDGSYDSSTGVSSTPEYGKVFISVKSTTGVDLTSTQKDNLVKGLAPYKVASVTPVIVDAETTELILGVTFNFNSSSTTSTGTELASLVNATLQSYNTSDLQSFNRPFRHSKVLRLIDETDTAILNNTTTVTIAKKFSPTLSTATSYNINFNNRFYNPVSGYNATGGGIVSSTGFYMNSVTTIEYFFDDDGSGNLRIYYLVGNTRTYTNSAAGTVDYPTGLIKINSMVITGVGNIDDTTSSQIRITALPNSNDIVPVRNQILEIDFTNSTITSSVDATATTGKGYTTSTTSTGATTTTVSTTTSTPSSSAY